jgi:hypothetical protein
MPEDGGQVSARSSIQAQRRVGESAALVDADDHAVAADFLGAAGIYAKLHRVLLVFQLFERLALAIILSGEAASQNAA